MLSSGFPPVFVLFVVVAKSVQSSNEGGKAGDIWWWSSEVSLGDECGTPELLFGSALTVREPCRVGINRNCLAIEVV